MNIAEYALKNRILVVAVLICLVVGGAFAYNSMSKLEDPEIKVKVAVVAAVYPGATAYETELEVTRPLEETIRRISEVGTVTSQSFDDMAIITVTLKTTTPDSDTQQEWDMLRRKVNDAKASLPASAQVMVMDDYGDVYGMFYALTFDGYGYEEAGRYADMVCRELSDIEGVSKAITYGERTRCVNIDMKADRMANLGVHPTELLTTLNSQNSVIYSGYFDTPDRRMKIEMGDAYESIEDIRNLIIQGHEDDQLKLSDVADVTYGWQTPVRNSMKYDGQPAIGLLISAESGTDIIKIGKEVEARLEEIKAESVPAGMEFHKVFFQPEIVGSHHSHQLSGDSLRIVLHLRYDGRYPAEGVPRLLHRSDGYPRGQRDSDSGRHPRGHEARSAQAPVPEQHLQEDGHASARSHGHRHISIFPDIHVP